MMDNSWMVSGLAEPASMRRSESRHWRHLTGARRVILGSLFVIGLLGTSLASRPLAADELDDLRAQVQQMQQQLQAMQGGSGGGAGPVAAQQVVQMQQFQQQLANMQGQIEQAQIKINDLTDKFDRAQKDNEFRLSALEQGQGGGAGGAAAPATTPPPAQGAAPQGSAAPAPQGSSTAAGQGAAPAANTAGQPHVLGTIDQGTQLPQAPAGAAEAAAAAAGNGGDSNVVLPGDTPKDQYDYAFGLMQKGSYPEAEVAFKSFLKDHPSDPLASNAQYWLGESYYARQDYKSASIAFAEGYQKYPNGPKVVDNLLKLGLALGQSGQKDNACVALKQLDKKYPDAAGSIKDRAVRAKQRFGCPA